jgi:membrane protease YdiL (CAAX protease family)
MSMLPKAAAFGRAALVSLAIVLIGQGLWQPLVMANIRYGPQAPWAVAVMAAVLAGLMFYLSGRGWPRSTRESRARLFSWNPIPARTFALAVGAGVLALCAFGGLWIVAADLWPIPAGIQPKVAGVPLPTLAAFLLMSSIAAPLTEEAAFRGYAMGLLERAWGSPLAAMLGSTALFAAVHVTQGIDPIKLGLYFTAGLIFAVVARLTRSLYAAMVVHGLGDILGFTVLWPHDARPHAMGLGDPAFVPALAALLAFAPCAALAFRALSRTAAASQGPVMQPA